MSSLSQPAHSGWVSRVRRRRSLIALPAVLLFATPIFAVNAPQDVRIPQLTERAKPVAAVFSHWAHNTQHCYSCHPGIFPQAPLGFTHQDMREGRFCGSCHDGQSATAIRAMRCEGCHVAP